MLGAIGSRVKAFTTNKASDPNMVGCFFALYNLKWD